jgi:hypothetical protein
MLSISVSGGKMKKPKIKKSYFGDTYGNKNAESIFRQIITSLIRKNEIYYFDMLRECGDNLTPHQMEQYRTDIPRFFNTHGAYCDKENPYKVAAAIGMLPLNEITIDGLFPICSFYRETAFFKPNSKCTWEEYSKNYAKYHMCNAEVFIEMEYTDCVIVYSEGLYVFGDSDSSPLTML